MYKISKTDRKQIKNHIYPIGLRMAQTPLSFGCSKSNKVNSNTYLVLWSPLRQERAGCFALLFFSYLVISLLLHIIILRPLQDNSIHLRYLPMAVWGYVRRGRHDHWKGNYPRIFIFICLPSSSVGVFKFCCI